VKHFFAFFSSTLAVLGSLLLLLVISVYIAVEPDLYHRGLMHLFPHRSRARAGQVLSAMALLDGPEKAIWVAAAYTAIQQAENHLLIPLQAAMALVLGFLGLLIAVPLLGAIMVPVKMLYVEDVVGDEVTLPGEREE
jgi:predicted PurR-regulated permease PerM